MTLGRGARTYSIHLSTRGAIAELETLPLDSDSIFRAKPTGAALTNGDALAALTIELAKGRECLPLGEHCAMPCPMAGCPGFDYKGGGCPGYPTPQHDEGISK